MSLLTSAATKIMVVGLCSNQEDENDKEDNGRFMGSPICGTVESHHRTTLCAVMPRPLSLRSHTQPVMRTPGIGTGAARRSSFWCSR